MESEELLSEAYFPTNNNPSGSDNFYCFICSSVSSNSDTLAKDPLLYGHLSPTEKLKSSQDEISVEDAVFLIRILLEVPNHKLEDKYFLKLEQLELEWLTTCSECRKAIKQAKLIYNELLETSKRFRNVQRQIVQIFKELNTRKSSNRKRRKTRHAPENNEDGISASPAEKCRLFVSEYSYGDNTHSLLIQDLTLLTLALDCKVKDEVLYDEPTDDHFSISSNSMEMDQFEDTIFSDQSQTACSMSAKDNSVNCDKDNCSISIALPNRINDDIKKELEEETDEIKNGLPSSNQHDETATFNDETNKCFGKVKPVNIHQKVQGKRVKRQSLQSKTETNARNVHEKKKGKSKLKKLKPLSCKHCRKRFTAPQGLKLHIQKMHGDNFDESCLFKCPEEGCSRTFYNSKPYKMHLLKHKKEPGPKQLCSLCDMKFFESNELREHKLMMHTEGNHGVLGTEILIKEPQVECPVCHRFYKNVLSIRRHFKKAHPNDQIHVEPNEIPCPWEGCDKVYSKRATLEIHLSTHRNDPKFKCITCGENFYQQQKLKRHEESKHGLGGPKICDICGRNLPTQSALLQHQKERHQIESRKYVSGLKTHAQRAVLQKCTEKSPPSFKCPSCDNTYLSMARLKYHITNAHEQKFPFICDVCDKGFKMEKLLNHHKIAAHGIGGDISEIPWYNLSLQCPVTGCRRRFGQKYLFVEHMEDVHAGDEGRLPFMCTHCGKGFACKFKLKFHEMAHINKDTKPFMCETCGKGYSTPHNRMIHERDVHKKQAKNPRQKKDKNVEEKGREEEKNGDNHINLQ